MKSKGCKRKQEELRGSFAMSRGRRGWEPNPPYCKFGILFPQVNCLSLFH